MKNQPVEFVNKLTIHSVFPKRGVRLTNFEHEIIVNYVENSL